MARVNIHLQDELKDKLQKTNINVSAVCQAALEKELKRGEKIKLEDGTMEKLKSKIEQQKKESDNEDKEMGKKYVKESVENDGLDYQDFKLAEKYNESNNNVWDFIIETEQENIKEYIAEEEEKYQITINIEKFCEGYIEAVQEIGKEIGAYD